MTGIEPPRGDPPEPSHGPTDRTRMGSPDAAADGLPRHHDPAGGFRNPWPTFGERGSALRWALQRITGKLPSDPDPDEIPRADPGIRTDGEPRDGAQAEGTGGERGEDGEGEDGEGGSAEEWSAEGRTGEARTDPRGDLRATWVGHATFLLQMGGLNLLTDPHWSERASPVSWAGPKRLTPPGIPLEALPHIDGVLLSHDHLDHLDRDTVRHLARQHGSDLRWYAPLGYAGILQKWGASRITELDWYESATLTRDGRDPARLSCLPAQHWTARTPFSRNRRLWCSWSVRSPAGSIYFGGDSGWFPEYPEIGRRAGPFDLVLLPIGAYAPRWFMKPVHMTPEEAVTSYRELGATGVLAGMHWGTFRLSDEHPLEPPDLLRTAWARAALPKERLWIPAIGETRSVPG